MLAVTKIVLKKLLEFKILRSIPGRMRLKSKAPENIYKNVEQYEDYLKSAILLLDGIDEVEFNFNIGTALILYNIEKTYEAKVLKWINKIIQVGIDNQETIEEYFNRDIEYLEMLIEQQLKEEVEKL